MKDKPIIIVMNHSPFPENANGVNKIICNYIKSSKRKFIIFQINGDRSELTSELDVMVYRSNSNIFFSKRTYLEKKLNQIKREHSTNLVLFISLDVAKLFSKSSIIGSTIFLIDNAIIYYFRKLRESNILLSLYSVYRIIQLCIAYKKLNGKVAFVSDLDSQVFALVSSAKVKTIPNGVATIDSTIFKKTVNPKIIFHGNFSYEPNIKAAKKFLSIAALDKFSSYSFLIFGNGSEVLSSESSNVNILGYVDNLNEIMKVGDVYFSPLSIGSGVQNKILEAFQHGLYIIGTPTSFSGIHWLNHLNDKGFISVNINELSKIEYILKEYFDDQLRFQESLLENQNFMQTRASWSESVKIMEDFVDGSSTR